MKQLVRRLFNMLTLLSALVAVAAGAIGVRSVWVQDSWLWRYIPEDMSFYDQTTIVISRGGMKIGAVFGHFGFFGGYIKRGGVFAHETETAREYPRLISMKWDPDDQRESWGGEVMGFEVRREVITFHNGSLRHRGTSVTVPLAAVAAVAALLPIRFVIFARRARGRGS